MTELLIVIRIWAIAISANSAAAYVGVNYNEFTERARGFSFHPNHLALTAVMGFGACIALSFLSHNIVSRCAWLTAGAFCVVGISSSGSRAGLIGALIVLIFSAVVLRSRLMMIGIVTISAIAWVVLAAGVVRFSPGSAAGRLMQDSDSAAQSNTGREAYISDGLQVISKYFFTGSGFADTLQYHNLLLQIVAAAGVLGIVGFLIVLRWSVIPLLVNSRIRGLSFERRVLILGIASGYAGFLVADLFQNAIWERFAWFSVPLICLLYYGETPLEETVSPTASETSLSDSCALNAAFSPVDSTPANQGSVGHKIAHYGVSGRHG